MKRLILSVAFAIASLNAVAQTDSVVTEYQYIYGLQKTAPFLAEGLVSVNINTSTACDAVSSFESLLKFDEVIALVGHIKNNGGMDGSDVAAGLLDKATIAVCQSIISSMLDKPKAISDLEKNLAQITSTYSHSLSEGIDDHVALKQLSSDLIDLRNQHLSEPK